MASATASSKSGERPGEKVCSPSMMSPNAARPRIVRIASRTELAAPSRPSTAYAIACSILSPIDVAGSVAPGARESAATSAPAP